ncbi:MAG: hypothetical protein ACRD7E_16345, partial [Bryobacteraceae bacterium]
CSHRSEDGEPMGDIAVWDEIRFPFDPKLEASEDLSQVPIRHSDAAPGQQIEELYSCDSSGALRVQITNTTSGFVREYRLGRWAGKEAPVTPGKKKAARSRSAP